jgi:hypothetical protein
MRGGLVRRIEEQDRIVNKKMEKYQKITFSAKRNDF